MRVELSVLLKNHIIRKASCCGMPLEALQREDEQHSSEVPGAVKSGDDPEDSSGIH